MSEFLKIEQGKVYFLTMTIVEWIDLFTRECYADILVDSIKYCQHHKGLEIYAYVIMPSHAHLIASCEGNLSHILRDMKEHTSKLFIKEIIDNKQESRKEWLLDKLTTSKPTKTGKPSYRVWQEGNYPIELYSDRFIAQKEHYIHMNPVVAGIVSQPHHYRLSSACEDSPIKVLPIR
ncbi:MAG: transposase [Bacteroidetes bacterium]|nr:MAG: transposase [Bacteroidota bacterium]